MLVIIYKIFRSLKSILLLYVIISPSIASCNNDYNPTYFSPDTHTSLCDKYIKNNASSFQNSLHQINIYYNENKLDELEIIKNDKSFNEYVTQLSECSVTYRYSNKINYFRSSSSYIHLLLDAINEPKRNHMSTERVNDLVSDITDDIDKILMSSKISNPNN